MSIDCSVGRGGALEVLILSEPGEMAFLLPNVARYRAATLGQAFGIRQFAVGKVVGLDEIT